MPYSRICKSCIEHTCRAFIGLVAGLSLLANGPACWGETSSESIGWSEVTRLGNGARIDALVSLGEGIVLAGTRDKDPGRIFQSRDFGATWTEISKPLESGVLNLLKLDAKTVLASTLQGHIYKSTDAGKTWIDKGAVSRHRIYSMVAASDGIVLASDFDATGGHVFRSTDAGEHWIDTGRLSDKPLYRFQTVDDGILLNGEAGRLYKTKDQGQTWREVGTISQVPLYAIEALPDGIALLGDAEGRVFRSADHGETWQQRAHVHQPLDDFVVIDGVVYLSAYEQGNHIFRSHDAGQSWSDLGPLAGKDILDHAISLVDENTSRAIGGTTTGRILRCGTIANKDSTLMFTGVVQDAQLLNGIEDVQLHGKLAILPCREGHRVTVCNIADPANPKVLSTFTHDRLAEATGLARNGHLLYVSSCYCQQTDRRPALLIVNAEDPTNLKLLSIIDVGKPGYLYKVSYHNGFCYVAHQSDKTVYAIDVHDPQQPKIAAKAQVTSDSDGPFSVQWRNDHLLVGTLFGDRNRLAIIDVRQPQKPKLTQTLTGPEYCTIAGSFVENYFYAAAWSRDAMFIFDVSNIEQVKQIGVLQDARLGKPNRCVVVKDRAYLPMVKGDGVAVVDISDPHNPKWINSFSDPLLQKTYGIAAQGDLLLIGSRDGDSLVIMDRYRLEAK